jgi:ADP-heptose:LPS heptosyltransferase
VHRSPQRSRDATTNPQQVLICLRFGIGDVVMELPALRGLRAEWPQAHFCALGAWPAIELLEGDPLFEDVLSIQAFGFVHWGDEGTPAAREALTGWCRKRRFDCVIDAWHAPSGVRRVLEGLAVRTLNTTSEIVPDPDGPGGGARSIWRSAVAAWGITDRSAIPAPALYIVPAARECAAMFMAHHGLFGRRLVGIVPVGSSRLKRWPLTRFCELINRLHLEHDYHVLVFGIPSRDRPSIDWLERHVPAERFTRVEPMHLQRTAALIRRCRVLLSNDTGLMHISAAVGIPTIGLFGPTSPRVALPDGAQAIAAGLPCQHRLERRFGPPACVLENRCLMRDRSCIDAITVDAVLAAIAELGNESRWHNGGPR